MSLRTASSAAMRRLSAFGAVQSFGEAAPLLVRSTSGFRVLEGYVKDGGIIRMNGRFLIGESHEFTQLRSRFHRILFSRQKKAAQEQEAPRSGEGQDSPADAKREQETEP